MLSKTMTRNDLRTLVSLLESSIDFPREDLPAELWDKQGETYVLKSEIKSKLFTALDAYAGINLRDIAKELHLVGSTGTNQWTETSDIDVHVIPDTNKIPGDQETLQRDIKHWYKKQDIKIGEHKIEVYLQLNPTQEYVGDTLYDLMKDEWVKGPKKVDKNFNPYEEFSDVIATIRDVVGETDKLMGELKRDVIDYDVIKTAVKSMNPETQGKLKTALQGKLQQIETDIQELMKDKKEWIEMRKNSSTPATPEQALKDVDYVKKWHDENAVFKFLSRYQYMRLIQDMEDMLSDDGKIDAEEVAQIQNMLGVMGQKEK